MNNYLEQKLYKIKPKIRQNFEDQMGQVVDRGAKQKQLYKKTIKINLERQPRQFSFNNNEQLFGTKIIQN